MFAAFFAVVTGSEWRVVLDEVASRRDRQHRSRICGKAKQWGTHLLSGGGTDVSKIKSSDLAAAIKTGNKTTEEPVRNRAQIVGVVLSNLVGL